ncbi:P-loop NTPase fold protein [Arcobacter arenosus]|uniref:P-loop NTPase fold protein n=1 Tax=Arcobacter arenosus TaxID=2576037 RepID=UPI003BACD763
MASQEELQEYLVGKTGYLKNSDNNSKVIMLSGKWGSGKTHFWQKEIMKKLNDEENKTPNHYISLYGKTSIQEIKDEIFIEIFKSVDSFEIEEKSKELAKNTLGIASSLSKSISIFGINVDLSKLSEKPFEKLEEVLENKKLKKTEEYLNNGAIICFDDFERKSKDIDLNDLFGFITQLSLNFKCKIVIILNDDVFKGEEKDIFSNVKEKTVSKYLYYNPTIEELFNSIYNDEKKKDKYKNLDEYRELILKTIEETKELNARIYIQVLDNLLEWIKKTNKEYNDEKYIKFLVFVNINFILNHYIFEFYSCKDISTVTEENKIIYNLKVRIKSTQKIPQKLEAYIKQKEIESYADLYNILPYKESKDSSGTSNYTNDSELLIDYIKNNKNLIKSELFLKKYLKIFNFESNENNELEKYNYLSKFIETGILIKENN